MKCRGCRKSRGSGRWSVASRHVQSTLRSCGRAATFDLNAFIFILTSLAGSCILCLNVFNYGLWGGLPLYIVGCYVSYLLISLAVTVWVARTLHTNGRVFLVDAFHGNAELADSVNHLLVVGFYLINIGYVTLALRTTGNLDTLRGAIELVSDKIGLVLLVLGGMHFFNLFVFSSMRKRSRVGSSLDVSFAHPATANPAPRV